MTGRPYVVVDAVLAGMKPGIGYTAAGMAWMIGVHRRATDQALRRMATNGQIGMRRIGDGRVYFTTQAAADAFSAEDSAALAEQARQRKADSLAAINRRLKAAGMHRNRVTPARPSVPVGVHIPKQAAVDRPIDMSQAVMTIAKTPACRFAVDPDSITPGAFLLDLPAGRWSDYALRRPA